MQLQTMHAECDALTDEKDLAEKTKLEEICKYVKIVKKSFQK